MDEFNSAPPDADVIHRDAARESIFLSAMVKFASSNSAMPVRIRNISAGGMMVDCLMNVPIGEAVSAEIKNVGTVTGKVAWSVSPRMGIAFDKDINPAAARVRVQAPHKVDDAYRGLSGYKRPGLALR